MGGVGVDLKSIGLIVTPVYVEVITMTLLFATEPPTEPNKHVNLTVSRSGILPLVSKAALDKFVPGEQGTYIEQEATSCTSVFPSDDDSIPTGMWMLWKLVCQDDNALGLEFFGGSSSSTKATYQAEHVVLVAGEQALPQRRGQELGKVLGYGTHGIVYSVKRDSSLVVKSSVVGDSQYIERELKALLALQDGDRHPSIAVLHSYGRTMYEIRGTMVDVPAFASSPRGRRVEQALVDLSQDEIKNVFTDVMSALDFAKKKHVFHLDVCARNIIYSDADPGRRRYVLIDWGCSVCGFGARAMGFRGSLAFAHRVVHTMENTDHWVPDFHYDVASLCFTICALDKGVPVPWQGFYIRMPDDTCFEDRRQQTEQSLRSLGLMNYKFGGRQLTHLLPGILASA